jgi:hypothetical protein
MCRCGLHHCLRSDLISLGGCRRLSRRCTCLRPSFRLASVRLTTGLTSCSPSRTQMRVCRSTFISANFPHFFASMFRSFFIQVVSVLSLTRLGTVYASGAFPRVTGLRTAASLAVLQRNHDLYSSPGSFCFSVALSFFVLC